MKNEMKNKKGRRRSRKRKELKNRKRIGKRRSFESCVERKTLHKEEVFIQQQKQQQ